MYSFRCCHSCWPESISGPRCLMRDVEAGRRREKSYGKVSMWNTVPASASVEARLRPFEGHLEPKSTALL